MSKIDILEPPHEYQASHNQKHSPTYINTMGGVYSCPEGYEMLKQSVYKDSVRLCLHKQSLRMSNDDPTNYTFITDIANPTFSGAEDIKAQSMTVLCLLLALIVIVAKN